ncbi:MAG: hypothetical protein ACOYMG_07465, partial [Candidatus Methylumidiphilus sp.]
MSDNLASQYVRGLKPVCQQLLNPHWLLIGQSLTNRFRHPMSAKTNQLSLLFAAVLLFLAPFSSLLLAEESI